jgi:hypothetical protein
MLNPTKETLDLTKAALRSPMSKEEALAKGVTVSTGLVYYDLQAPAKNLYPVITPLRNKIPRVGRPNGYGDSAKWKQIAAITGSGFDAMGWVPEGQRSGTMSYTSTQKAAAYCTLGEEDYATYEAIAAGEGFENVESTDSLRTLQKMMLKEESALLGGNGGGVQLGTPGTPSLSQSGSTGTLPALTYSVIVVALTYEGWRNASLAGGVATTKTITGADGGTFVLNGGSSNKSASQTQAITLGQILYASVTAIQGAMAYAWFVGPVGGETLQAITTINSATFSAPLAAGRQAATAITQDSSSNPGLAFDGLLTQALNTSNLAYVNALATGTAGTGTPLTSSGRGSVVEIDTMLQSMWDNYRISPTVIYVNSQELKNITNKVLGTGTSSLLRYDAPASGSGIVSPGASGVIEWYFNPFGGTDAAEGGTGGIKMPIKVHPNMPPGTIAAYAEELPAWYQNNEVPNVAEVITRKDYYRIEWPPRTRKREYGVYAEEVLAVYATFGLGVITNIANG